MLRRFATNANRNGTRASGYTSVLIVYIVRHVLRLVYLSYQSHLQPVTSSDVQWSIHLHSLLTFLLSLFIAQDNSTSTDNMPAASLPEKQALNGSTISKDFDVDEVLEKLTTPEKISLLSGTDFWHTASVHRLGIPAIRTTDGPNGVRGTRFFDGVPAACLPCGTHH